MSAKKHKEDAHLCVLVRRPCITESVMHGQCNTSPTVTLVLVLPIHGGMARLS